MPVKKTTPASLIQTLIAPAIVGGPIQGVLVLLPGSIVSHNEHGTSTLQRTFFGFTDEIYDLAPQFGDKDKWIPFMTVTQRNFTEGAGRTATVTVTYTGLIDNKIPKPVLTGSWSEQTAQLPITQDAGGNALGLFLGFSPGLLALGNNPSASSLPAGLNFTSEVTVTYHAPQTTFKYLTRKQPQGPIYTGLLLTPIADFQIVEMRPARVVGRVCGVVDVRCRSYDVETAGSYWQCTEVNQGVMIPPDAILFGYQGLVAGQFPYNQVRLS
jgi:hypothetical protein